MPVECVHSAALSAVITGAPSVIAVGCIALTEPTPTVVNETICGPPGAFVVSRTY